MNAGPCAASCFSEARGVATGRECEREQDRERRQRGGKERVRGEELGLGSAMWDI